MSDFNPYERPDADIVMPVASELEVHEGVRRPTGNAIQWVGDGWSMVSRQWGTWLGATFLYMLVSSAAGMIPFIGFIFQMLISPVLAAGMLYLASQADKGEVISVSGLFQGFQDGPGKLMMFGLAFTLMIIAVMVVTVLIAIPLLGSEFSAVMSAAEGGAPPAPDPMLVIKMILLVGIYMLLAIPLMAAYWFGLPLVFFGEARIFDALKHSIVISLRNFLPLFVYGLVLMCLFMGVAVGIGLLAGGLSLVGEGIAIAVAIIAGIIFMLGVMAVTMASWYASFRDIFISPA